MDFGRRGCCVQMAGRPYPSRQTIPNGECMPLCSDCLKLSLQCSHLIDLVLFQLKGRGEDRSRIKENKHFAWTDFLKEVNAVQGKNREMKSLTTHISNLKEKGTYMEHMSYFRIFLGQHVWPVLFIFQQKRKLQSCENIMNPSNCLDVRLTSYQTWKNRKYPHWRQECWRFLVTRLLLPGYLGGDKEKRQL